MKRKREMKPRLPVAVPDHEVAAMTAARSLINHFRDGANSPFGMSSVLGPGGTTDMTRALIFRPMMLTAAGRMDVVNLARAGWSEADAMLRGVILEGTSRDPDLLPLELKNYAHEYIYRGGFHSQQDRGEKKSKRFSRDIFITMTVAAIIDCFHLPLLRAFEIVSEALVEVRINMGQASVRSSWDKHHRAMPTVAGWGRDFIDAVAPRPRP